MRHQNGKKKLNCSSKHRKALLRNQAIHFIMQGVLETTSARVKEVKRLVERVVTIAKRGDDLTTKRKLIQVLPYKEEAVQKLLKEIAPLYRERFGGYTRAIAMHRRIQDTASISRLLWV